MTGYAYAVAGSAIALVVALILMPALEVSPFPIFLAAVTLSAWRGGLGPGLVATVIGVAAMDFLFLAPTYALELHYASDAVNLAVFALVAVLISTLNAQLRAARDRAERLATDRAAILAELERRPNEFLTNISHDLRTPLTAIKHSIEVLLANEPADLARPLHDLLINVEQAAGRMAVLVDDLLALARLQAGVVRLRLEPCDLSALAERAVRAIEPLASARAQRIELESPHALPVYVDPGRLERALLNLLSNAHAHGRRGGLIRVAVAQVAGEVRVTVADDGPGIPEGEQSRIFERFYRVEPEASRTQGSGLGLPIARALVELHGGRIWVNSTPGEGATFGIALPVAA